MKSMYILTRAECTTYGVKSCQPSAGTRTLIDRKDVRKNNRGKKTIIMTKMERARIVTPGRGAMKLNKNGLKIKTLFIDALTTFICLSA